MYYYINSFPSLDPQISPQDLSHLPVFLLAISAVWHTIISFLMLTVLLRSCLWTDKYMDEGFLQISPSALLKPQDTSTIVA